MVRVLEISDPRELESFRLPWHALWTKTPQASIFQSLDWLLAYWRHFGREQKLRVLIVQDERECLGIVPLTIHPESTRLGKLRVLTYPLQDWGNTFAPIGPNPSASLLAAMRHVRETRRDWDVIDLRWIDQRHHDRAIDALAMKQAGFQAATGVWRELATIDFAGSWEDYLATRSVKFRGNIRRLERRVAELGDVHLVRYRPAGALAGEDDPRWDLYEQCVALASRSWQGGSESGTTLTHPEVAGFFRETHELAARLGCLDLNLLMSGQRPLAFTYNYHRDGKLCGIRAGYDSEYAKRGVGTAMYAATFRDSFERGDHSIDLGPGHMEIKRPWESKIVRTYRCSHYSRSPRSTILRLKRWAMHRINPQAPATLGKHG